MGPIFVVNYLDDRNGSIVFYSGHSSVVYCFKGGIKVYGVG